MSTLLPSMSSDDENGNWTEDDEKDAIDTGEVNEEFEFGGILVRLMYFYVIFHFVSPTEILTLWIDCFLSSFVGLFGFSRAKIQEVQVISFQKRLKRDGPIKRHCGAWRKEPVFRQYLQEWTWRLSSRQSVVR